MKLYGCFLIVLVLGLVFNFLTVKKSFVDDCGLEVTDTSSLFIKSTETATTAINFFTPLIPRFRAILLHMASQPGMRNIGTTLPSGTLPTGAISHTISDLDPKQFPIFLQSFQG